MEDITGNVTPVADEQSEAAVQAAVAAAAALAQAQPLPTPPVETQTAEQSAPVQHAAAPTPSTLSPLGATTPGAQAFPAAAGQASAASGSAAADSRSERRERSPRREADTTGGTPAHAEAAETPQLAGSASAPGARAAAEAALRGASVSSLPDLEADAVRDAAPNPRGGALL